MTLDHNFSLRRFLHGKLLLATLNLFDSKPPFKKMKKQWDAFAGCSYETEVDVTHPEYIHVWGLIQNHARLESYTVLCWRMGITHAFADVELPYIWNHIPNVNGWETWRDRYDIPFFQEQVIREHAVSTFVDQSRFMAKANKLTLTRQTKPDNDTWRQIPPFFVLENEQMGRSPFDFGIMPIVKLKTKRRLEI